IGDPSYVSSTLYGRILGYLGGPTAFDTGSSFGPGGYGDATHPGFGESVAADCDLDGDGFADYATTTQGPGPNLWTFGSYTNGRRRRPDVSGVIGGDAPAGAARASVLGTPTISVLGRSAMGRARVQMEYEIKPYATPFNNSGHVLTAWMNTGAPGPG